MLKNIDPLLHADLLQALRAMGHNDTIVIADGNFPATALARRLLRVDGASAPRVAEAIVSVLPIDAGPDSVVAMATDAPTGRDAVTEEFAQVCDSDVGLLPPTQFYEAARQAFAIVQTGEARFYGNLMLRKGVVPPTN